MKYMDPYEKQAGISWNPSSAGAPVGAFRAQKTEAEFYLPEFKGLIDDPQTHSCLVVQRRCQGMGCFEVRRKSASKIMQKHLFLLEKQTVEKLKHDGLGKVFFV